MTTSRIRIGNQNNCHVPANVPFEYALGHGFDAFEWFSDKGRGGWGEEDFDHARRHDLRQLARERDLLFSIHAPFTADPTTAEGAAAIRKSIDCCAEMGGAVVNLHFFPQRAPKSYAESLQPLLELARSVGVRLSLENTPETSPEHVNEVFSQLAGISEAAGQVGLCLDMGHANLYTGTRNDYLDWIDRLGRHVPIIHWHCHENWGDRDAHLTIFTGPSRRDMVGIRGVVERLLHRGFCGNVILEQWPNPPELLVQAREKLLALIEEVCQASSVF